MKKKITAIRVNELISTVDTYGSHPFFITPKKQNMVLAVDSMVTEMQKQKRIEFCGEAPWIYFKFHYCDPQDRDFAELADLHNALEDAAGKAAAFQGVLCIDLSPWIEHETEDYFDVLLSYLYDRSDDIFLTFYVAKEEEHSVENIDDLYRKTAGYFRVKWMELVDETASRYQEQMGEMLLPEGFYFGMGAEKKLEEILEEALKSPDFIGDITVDNLCEDLKMFAREKGIGKNMTRTFLEEYESSSTYLHCFMKKEKTDMTIGLIPR